MSNRIPNRIHTRVVELPATQGANALSTAPAPIPASRPEDSTAKRRTTLSIVPGIQDKRRIPFIVSIFTVVIASVVAVLLINVSIANGQYTAVNLRAQERALSQENEALRQEALYLGAPQVIAKKAAELGMVKPGAPAAIDLDTGKIAGTPTAAEKPNEENKAKSGTLKTPASPERPLAVKKPSESAEQAPKEKASVEPAAQPEKAKEAAPKAPVAQKPATPDGTRPSFAQTELNGGTIPAPSLQAPGQ